MVIKTAAKVPAAKVAAADAKKTIVKKKEVVKEVSKAGAKRSAGSSSVFVRGFDFGTTDEVFEAHMSGAGSIEKVKWVSKGSAEVTYSSPEEAAAAIEQLHKTTIEGNSRFMDVLPKRDGDRPTKRFNSGAGGGNWHQSGGGGGGVLGAVLQLLGGGGGGGGGGWKGGGKGWGGAKWEKTFKVDKSGGELGEFSGVIKSFSMKDNYGFIECDDLSSEYGDVFLHGNMKGGYRQGQTVKFTAVLNKDGKAQALDLKSGLK